MLMRRRLIRDQANKTLDMYLARIRKYAETLPDTVQPPPGAVTGSGATPRMGTPANDTSSWAGWAISSFTNKIATASGEMQAPPASSSTEASRVTSPEPRASSVPPTSFTHKPKTIPNTALKPTPFTNNPFAPPPKADDEELDSGWGDDAADAWGADEEVADPFAPTPSQSNTTTTLDDGGEPDFAGWLEAQAEAKKKNKNILPKGLAKTSAAASVRPGMQKSNSTGTPANAVKRTLPAARPKPVAVKKVEEKKVEEEDDAWGEAW